MPTMLSNSIESTFRFTVETETLKKSKSVSTPKFAFSNSKWKVTFSRKTNDGGVGKYDALAINLKSVSLKRPSISSIIGCGYEWSREAQATFKLLRTDGNDDKSVVKHLPRKTFEKEYLSHGIDDFIEWDEFLKVYAHDKLVTFEIIISASPLKRKRNTIQEMIPISAKMLVVIKSPINAKNMVRMISSEIVIKGIRWTVYVQKNDKHLSVFLRGNPNDMEANWYNKVDASFTLLSSNLNSVSVSRNLVCEYEKGVSSVEMPKFLEWSEFVDRTKGYIQNHKAKLNIDIKVKDREPTWKLQCPTALKTSSSYECIATTS